MTQSHLSTQPSFGMSFHNGSLQYTYVVVSVDQASEPVSNTICSRSRLLRDVYHLIAVRMYVLMYMYILAVPPTCMYVHVEP